MATQTSPSQRVTQWDSKFFKEYLRSNRFKRYMGTSQNSIIQIKEDLTKKKGDTIVVNLVGALDKTPGYNTGATPLVGNEKALPNEGHRIKIGVVRDATVINVEEEQASPIQIRNAGKTALKDLAMRYMRDDLIDGFGSVSDGAGGAVNYGLATPAQLDTWNGANADRVVYGEAHANTVAGNHAGSLANVTAATGRLTKEMVSLMKRTAQSAINANGDGIRPYRYGEDEETFVYFVGTHAYRDLKNDMQDVHKDARERAKMNPLFTGTTSLYWDGVVIREIPELPVYAGVGGGGVDVEPGYFCGAQALGVAWAQRTKSTTRKEDDYGFWHGVGFMELRGIEKVLWSQDGNSGTPKDWGVATSFLASVPDA